jgi:hypothetical protein
VGHALAAIEERATAIAEAAALAARIGKKLAKEKKPPARKKLVAEWQQAGNALVEAVRDFLAMCDPAADEASDVGAYTRTLQARFAPLAERFADVGSLEIALEAGAEIVENALWAGSNQDEIVKAEAGK